LRPASRAQGSRRRLAVHRVPDGALDFMEVPPLASGGATFALTLQREFAKLDGTLHTGSVRIEAGSKRESMGSRRRLWMIQIDGAVAAEIARGRGISVGQVSPVRGSISAGVVAVDPRELWSQAGGFAAPSG